MNTVNIQQAFESEQKCAESENAFHWAPRPGCIILVRAVRGMEDHSNSFSSQVPRGDDERIVNAIVRNETIPPDQQCAPLGMNWTSTMPPVLYYVQPTVVFQGTNNSLPSSHFHESLTSHEFMKHRVDLDSLQRTIHSEEELRTALGIVAQTALPEHLRSWDYMVKVFDIVQGFYKGEEMKTLNLDTFPEFVARAVACCASRDQIMQLPRERCGPYVFPWAEYIDIRFIKEILINGDSSLLPLENENEMQRFLRLLVTVDEDHRLQNSTKPLERFGNRSQHDGNSSCSGSLNSKDSASASHFREILEDIGVQASDVDRDSFKGILEKIPRLTSLSKHDKALATRSERQVPSLVDLCVQSVLDQNIDVEMLPDHLKERYLAKFFEKFDGRFSEVDLSKLPPSNAGLVVLNASDWQLLEIPRENRGAESLPWLEYSKQRFGEDSFPVHTSWGFVNSPMDIFYLRLMNL